MMRSISLVSVLLLAGCAGNPGNTADAGNDSGPRDLGVDMGDTTVCGSGVCQWYERCLPAGCAPYDGCGTGTDCAADEVCRHGYCIPATRDIDGDGFPAATDCNETDPTIHPGVAERCNTIDDDCNGTPDDGDPGDLCVNEVGRGVCMDGVCACPTGTFDIELESPNTCECNAIPPIGMGTSCATSFELGSVNDGVGTEPPGTLPIIEGNALPEGREIWYHFRGVDVADSTCDRLHVRAQFISNPGDAYRMQVFRGSCDAAAAATCDESPAPETYTDYTFRADFRTSLVGQCPCGPTTTNVSHCSDQSADYYVRVIRRPDAPISCETFQLEITNGAYTTP